MSRKSYLPLIFSLSLRYKVLFLCKTIYNGSIILTTLCALAVLSFCRLAQIHHVEALLLAFAPIARRIYRPASRPVTSPSQNKHITLF
jgi:hypothetical protein